MPEYRPDLGKPPTVMAGTTRMSGVPNTGQIGVTFGSTHQFSKFSGVVGPDVQIWLGAGRLEQGQLLPSAEPQSSGKPIVFYDGVATSGGPLSASNHKVIGVLMESASAEDGALSQGGSCRFDMVFTSGLAVSTASGQLGFACSFTPVVSG